jgi:hypothetical protein
MRRFRFLLVVAVAVAACGTSDEAATTTHTHEAGDMAHTHSMMDPVEATGDPSPTVRLTVTPDPVSGFNVYADVEHLVWAPAKAGLDHVDGEGHAHVYVDGEKVARIYGEWYHLTGLTPGTHEVTVSLNANTHAPYAVDGVEIADSVTIEAG